MYERYFLGLNSEELDNFLNNSKLSVNPFAGIQGRYLQIDKIMQRILFNLPEDKKIFLANKIKMFYNEEQNPNLNNNSLLQWISNGDVLVFYSRNRFIDVFLWITSKYLLSIKKENMLTLFEKRNYKIEILEKRLHKNLELWAFLTKTSGKQKKQDKCIFVFKTSEHVIFISPKFRVNLSEFCGEYINFDITSTKVLTINNFDFELVDEIADNNFSLENLRKKIMYNPKTKHLENRTEFITHYLCSWIIPAGEAAEISALADSE
ncbi:MAG: hypothetical protein KH301_07655 [Brachyspira sp.]|nr:hypothetical protein [Brachyspira sp.]